MGFQPFVATQGFSEKEFLKCRFVEKAVFESSESCRMCQSYVIANKGSEYKNSAKKSCRTETKYPKVYNYNYTYANPGIAYMGAVPGKKGGRDAMRVPSRISLPLITKRKPTVVGWNEKADFTESFDDAGEVSMSPQQSVSDSQNKNSDCGTAKKDKVPESPQCSVGVPLSPVLGSPRHGVLEVPVAAAGAGLEPSSLPRIPRCSQRAGNQGVRSRAVCRPPKKLK